MDSRLLFVDDERALLNGITRLLGLDYDIEIAESGCEGLEVIRKKGPFSVIFTDMRMPNMDGVEFATRAHAVAPDSTIIMLTGNQDQTTAVRAINEGRIFRFLNKPCERADLERAIEDGLRQYQLVTGEKELLHKTFAGSVKLLSDVIEVTQPVIAGRTDSIERRVAALREAAGIDDRWEFKLAGRLALLGLSLMPDIDRLKFDRSDHASPVAHKTLVKASHITSKLIRDIPRLGIVAQICERQQTANGQIANFSPQTPEEIAAAGAVLLRTAIHWDCLVRQGLEDARVSSEIAAVLPELPKEMLQVIREGLEGDESDASVDVSPGKLEEGMVVSEDISTDEGAVLLRRGQRLSSAMIERLKQRNDLRQIQVTAATASTSVPELIGA